MDIDGMSELRVVATLLESAATRMKTAGVAQPRMDARLLLAHAIGNPEERFYGREDAALEAEPCEIFEKFVTRRLNREPVSRILGTRGFWTLDLAINPASLDPRPDSETLIEAVLEYVPSRDAAIRVLDLGTGTGCLLLSVLAEYPCSSGLGIDQSDSCVELARRNAESNDLGERARFQRGDWANEIHTIFDVIMCNPPYIPSQEIAGLDPEVAVHEPLHALDGGADGLDCYRRLSLVFRGILAENGYIFLEIGHDQRHEVTEIMARAALRVVTTRADLAGRDRCLVLRAND
jgi:release factor glutamine methyltransferase